MDVQQLGGGLELDAASRERVRDLAERLARHRAEYYAGAPTISDAAYDALEDDLRRLSPAHPLLARIGAPVVSAAWEKARHEIAMGSLNKATSEEALDEWLARCDEILDGAGHGSVRDDLFVSEKLDGLSLELIYRDGSFAAAITRGDGDIGELITANVTRMRGVPRAIPHSGSLSVRGEIILRISDREQYFPDYSSTRNAAAGTSRRLDGGGCEHLTVLCYDVADELELPDEAAKIELLRRLGFATPSCFRGDVASVLALYRRYAEGRRTSLDYEIDGLVVRAASLRTQALLGDVNRRPRGAIALKFPSPTKLTTVVGVVWETGPSGRVTPVAFVEPVELVGAQVRRASLHNASLVRRLGIGEGDQVLVSRRNDVIPYVEEVVRSAGKPAPVPTRCSACRSELRVEGEYLACRNDACRARVMGRIHYWIVAVGALEWGDSLIAALIDRGLVREPFDLYQLSVDDIAALERHGAKSAENALAQLRSRLPLRLTTFLAALGIEGFSIQTARLLESAGFDLDALLGASVDDLAAIPGLGPTKAQNIVQGLSARRSEIERLRAGGLGPVDRAQAGALDGKSFCITGKHERGRKELVQLIEDHGGRVLSGVTKDLHFLLIDDVDSTSSKAVKARQYGTKLISEHDLEGMIEGVKLS